MKYTHIIKTAFILSLLAICLFTACSTKPQITMVTETDNFKIALRGTGTITVNIGGIISSEVELISPEDFSTVIEHTFSSDWSPQRTVTITGGNITGMQALYTKLTELDVSRYPGLTYLHCEGNALTTLDVSKNKGLTLLWVANNQLSHIDLSQNKALTELNVSQNSLTALDLSQNTALTRLECRHNHLTSLDVSKNTDLWVLDCSDNQLTSLDLSHNGKLESLHCYENRLTTLDISQNPLLSHLLCYDNQLTSIKIAPNTALININAHNNHLSENAIDDIIQVLAQRNGDYLNISGNPGAPTNSLPEVRAMGWEIVGYGETGFADNYDEYEEHIPYINIVMDTYAKNVKIFLQGSGTAMIDWGEGYSQTITFQTKEPQNEAWHYAEGQWYEYTYFDAKLRPITITGTDIIGFNCKGNQVTTLEIQHNMALYYLNCENNELTTLDVSGISIQSLWIANNQLTELKIGNNNWLVEVNAANNQLSASALNAMMTSLHTETNYLEGEEIDKVINIANNPGTDTADRSIAEKKGWAVFVSE